MLDIAPGTGRLSRWLFDAVHRQNLVYNQCWEDPAVDQQALCLRPEDRVLAITSAGCNTLDYALSGARVLAVDVNPRQNHLLELKRAGIRALGFEDFFDLFGRGGCRRTRELYAALRPELPEDSRRFWDREIRLFEPERSRGRSFYYGGTAGLVALAVTAWIRHGVRLWAVVERLLQAPTLEEQLEVYRAEAREGVLSDGLLRLVGSSPALSLLGVPAPQRRMVLEHPGGFPGFLRECMDHVMSVALLRENYFWSVYLNGRYSRESCPRYLQQPSFERLKAGLVENVRSFTGTVTACLARQSEPITAFVLLDHMDWMASHPRLLEEEWAGIFRVAGPGARVIFRSGARDELFLPLSVLRRLVFERERAAALHRHDRVGTYASFHIARLHAAR
ncbi:MAG TPA: BtaA family protein [Vicinamibacteria bacterium]|nr:BtaA family protein [Vicinamibacteria bacterium]